MVLDKVDASFRRLRKSDIEIGEPISFTVHDAGGTLVLEKGYVVPSEALCIRLVNKKVYVRAGTNQRSTSSEKTNLDYHLASEKQLCTPFEWLGGQYQLLETIYQEISDNPDHRTAGKIKLLAERIYRIGDKYHDGLLAAIHLWQGESYSHIKAFHVATLCDALGKRAGIGRDERISLICAGLTHDAAMWQLQDEIQTREEPLTEEQWQKIKSHPSDGIKILQKMGAADRTWVQAVWCHHERLNGSGYSRGLKEKDIGQPARILAIADTFAAMVRPRGDRAQRMPKDALRDIFLSRGEEIDGTLAQFFIKELGMFPPGSACQLATGEVGIATGPGANAASPDVEVIINAAGHPMKRAEYRDTCSKGYGVVALVPTPEHPDLQALLKKMWPKVPKNVGI
ncbi:MAG: HD domain-containing phosphohydrolase [Motiliproteus sp.]